MKFLVLNKAEKKSNDSLLFSNVIKLLSEKNNQITTNSSEKDIDCIFLFNKELLSRALKVKKELHIPIIFVTSNSNIVSNYVLETKNVDHIFIYKDKVENTIFPTIRCNYFNMPYFIADEYNMNEEEDDESEIQPMIYVNLCEEKAGDDVSLKLIKVLNRIENCDIVLNSNNRNLSKILNKNITISSDCDVEYLVKKSDLVIGSGYAALYGALFNKPTIVAGKDGYGGIVTKDNLSMHYENFFQGRIGGTSNELIPDLLLIEDLAHLSNIESYDFLNMDDLLLELREFNINAFFKAVNNVIEANNIIKVNKTNADLIFSPDFSLINTNEKKYLIMNNYTGFLLDEISYEEYMVIEHFEKGNSIVDLFKKNKPNKKINALIDKFINNKVLIGKKYREIIQKTN